LRHELKCAITASLGYRPTKHEIHHLLDTTVNVSPPPPTTAPPAADDASQQPPTPLRPRPPQPCASFDSFSAFVTSRAAARDERDDARSLFGAMDGARRGFLTREDVRAAFQAVCPSLHVDAVDAAFDEIDGARRGAIGFEQFEWIVHERVTPSGRAGALKVFEPPRRSGGGPHYWRCDDADD
jgi:Ca2+-binding EF-hand superfamily protein